MAISTNYNPDTDIPSLNGKVIFITGGTAGIGKATILNLAKHSPAAIVFTGRNAKSAQSVIAEVKTIDPLVKATFIQCDLSSLSSVHDAAKSFLDAKLGCLDVLINNAGIMGHPAGTSKDGFEIQFAVNYLSHALLTKMLLPALSETAKRRGEARIINLTSEAMYFCPTEGVKLDGLRGKQDNISMSGFLGKWLHYGQSKMAQAIYTQSLASKYPEITSVAINPGVVYTGLITELPLLDRWFIGLATWGKGIELHQGPWSTLWAATSKDGVKSGKAYSPVGVDLELKGPAVDKELEKKLWDWTEEALKEWV